MRTQHAESSLSLAPGFSRVLKRGRAPSRFNGFLHSEKPLKRFRHPPTLNTRLKPGANEKGARVMPVQPEVHT